MSYWRVEKEIRPIPKPNFREEYIALLEKVIEKLKESKDTNMPIDNKGTTKPIFPYSLPVILFSEATYPKTKDNGILKIHCYDDLRDFWKVLEILDSGAEIE